MFPEGCNKHFLVENVYSKLCRKNVRFENEEESSHGLWRKCEDMMPVKIV